jgi:hypothetical protein
MIRKTYLTTTFLVAVLLAALGLASLWQYVGFRGLVTERHWVRTEIGEGNVIVGHAYLAEMKYPQKVHGVSLGVFGRIMCASGTWTGDWRYIGLTLPLWSIVALLLIHPAVAFVGGPLRRRRRRRRNQCLNCGYAREGNTSGVCPECGNSLTCYTCGYDLTGNISGVCPECGKT